MQADPLGRLYCLVEHEFKMAAVADKATPDYLAHLVAVAKIKPIGKKKQDPTEYRIEIAGRPSMEPIFT